MKKTITYREITLAIGILVAMVIAVTLWVKDPRQGVTGVKSQVEFGASSSAKSLLDYTVVVFSHAR